MVPRCPRLCPGGSLRAAHRRSVSRPLAPEPCLVLARRGGGERPAVCSPSRTVAAPVSLRCDPSPVPSGPEAGRLGGGALSRGGLARVTPLPRRGRLSAWRGCWVYFTEAAPPVPRPAPGGVFLQGSFSNLDHEHVPGYLEGEPTTAWGLLDVVPRASPYTRPRSASRRSQLTVGAPVLGFGSSIFSGRAGLRRDSSVLLSVWAPGWRFAARSSSLAGPGDAGVMPGAGLARPCGCGWTGVPAVPLPVTRIGRFL